MKNAVRFSVAPWYLLGSVLHASLAMAMPELCRNFGNTALLPVVAKLWQTLVVPNIVFFALTLLQVG